MKLFLIKRNIRLLILVSTLLPVFPAVAALPGPLPPPPPAIPTPPPDADFNYVKVDDARGLSGDVTQIEIGTTGKDKIIDYGGYGNVTQGISANTGNDWLLQVGSEQNSVQTIDGGYGDKTFYQFGGRGKSA